MKVSRRRFLFGIGAATLGAAGVLAAYLLNRGEEPQPTRTQTSIGTTTSLVTERPSFHVEVLLENLVIPWSLSFAPDRRFFFTERPGRINVFSETPRRLNVFAEVPVAQIGEGGLLGLALSPDFDSDHFVYVYHTYTDVAGTWNRVVRYTDRNGRGEDPEVIFDRIPGAGLHDGGRIRFGLDGKLYVTAGDAILARVAQSLESLAGKILRLNPDGSFPDDNPFPNSPIYSYGHRNPQGIDWHRISGKLYATEHGPSANDEVNLIEAGKNYGWPTIVGTSNDPRFVNPIFYTGNVETWAPSGCSFHRGEKFAAWKNSFFIATLRGMHLHRFLFDPDTSKILASESLLGQTLGRLRDVVEGPDGSLYVLTSNRDGRGSPAPNDDRIVRLVPA